MKNLIQIDLSEEVDQSLVITRLKKQIGESINANRNEDVGKVTRLAVYWYAVGKSDSARSLLDEIVFKIESTGNLSLWAECCQAMLMRAKLSQLYENGALIEKIQGIIDRDDFVGPKRVKYFISNRPEHREALSLAEVETQKYQCEIYAQEVLHHLYYEFMLPSEDKDFAEAVSLEIASGLELNLKYLVEALASRRKANVHRIPGHPQD